MESTQWIHPLALLIDETAGQGAQFSTWLFFWDPTVCLLEPLAAPLELDGLERDRATALARNSHKRQMNDFKLILDALAAVDAQKQTSRPAQV